MTRSRAAMLNYLSGLALTAATMATGLVATPLLLRWLGQERFGAARAATDAGGYLGLLQLGYFAALLPLLAEALNRQDVPMLRRILGMGIRFSTKIGVLTLIAGLFLAAYIGKIVHVSASIHGDLQRSVLIGLIGIIFIPLTPLRTLADVGQESWVVNLSLLAQSVVITGLALIMAKCGFGISGQSVAAVAGLTVFQTILLIRGRRRVPDLLNVALHEPASPEAKQRMRKLQMWGFLLHASVTASFFADNVVIGAFMGAAMVTPFYITQRIIVICQGQLQGVAGATWAGLTELFHAGKRDLMRERYSQLLHLTVVGGLCILIPVAACNHAFTRLWVPSTPYAGESITILACLNAIFFGVSSLWIQMLDGAGFVKTYAIVGLVGGIVNLVCSVLATWKLGITGPLVGTLSGFLAVNLWAYPIQIRRCFGVPLKSTFLSIIPPLLKAIPVAAGIWWLIHRFPPRGWVSLIAAGSVTLAVSAAWTWIVQFDREARKNWALILSPVLGKFKSEMPREVNVSPADTSEMQEAELAREQKSLKNHLGESL